MQIIQELIASPWFWLGAASIFAALLAFAAYRAAQPKEPGGNSEDNSWVPTGRIDFVGPTGPDPAAHGKFSLQAEDTRVVNSIGGVEHHEIRWRNATLREAKKVVTLYHAHANVTPTPVVTTPGSIAPELEPTADADVVASRTRGIAIVKART
jgi:hypothetical protein